MNLKAFFGLIWGHIASFLTDGVKNKFPAMKSMKKEELIIAVLALLSFLSIVAHILTLGEQIIRDMANFIPEFLERHMSLWSFIVSVLLFICMCVLRILQLRKNMATKDKERERRIRKLKVTVIITTIVAVVAVMVYTAVNRPQIIASDNSDYIHWELDSKGNLFVYANQTTATRSIVQGETWKKYRNQISRVEVRDIEEIGAEAFANLPQLTEADLRGEIHIIGEGAFKNCPRLREIQIPESVEIIESNAFENCGALSDVKFALSSNNLHTIGDSAFQGCEKLKSLTIPESVRYIGANAFRDCKRLSDISLPSLLMSIEDGLFRECQNLKSVDITDITKGSGKDAQTFDGAYIPEKVSRIGAHAFEGCRSLKRVKLPSALDDLGESAFCRCKALREAEGMESCSITEVKNGTFAHCGALETLLFPVTLVSIEEHAFLECDALRSVTVRSALQNIDREAFVKEPDYYTLFIIDAEGDDFSRIAGFLTDLPNVRYAP